MIFRESPSGMTARTSTGSGSVGPRTMLPGRTACAGCMRGAETRGGFPSAPHGDRRERERVIYDTAAGNEMAVVKKTVIIFWSSGHVGGVVDAEDKDFISAAATRPLLMHVRHEHLLRRGAPQTATPTARTWYSRRPSRQLRSARRLPRFRFRRILSRQ